MRRLLYLGMLSVGMCLLSGCEQGDELAPTDDRQAFTATVAALNSPAEVAAFMAAEFTYVLRSNCRARSPEEMFALREGDCKDFAVFFSYVLAQHGFEASLVTYYYLDVDGNIYGHAVTLFIDRDGRQRYQSNHEILGPVAGIQDMLLLEQQLLGWTETLGYEQFPAGTTDVCIYAEPATGKGRAQA